MLVDKKHPGRAKMKVGGPGIMIEVLALLALAAIFGGCEAFQCPSSLGGCRIGLINQGGLQSGGRPPTATALLGLSMQRRWQSGPRSGRGSRGRSRGGGRGRDGGRGGGLSTDWAKPGVEGISTMKKVQGEWRRDRVEEVKEGKVPFGKHPLSETTVVANACLLFQLPAVSIACARGAPLSLHASKTRVCEKRMGRGTLLGGGGLEEEQRFD
jgi:hypothetical protein